MHGNLFRYIENHLYYLREVFSRFKQAVYSWHMLYLEKAISHQLIALKPFNNIVLRGQLSRFTVYLDLV